MRACSVENCQEKHYGFDYCRKHYRELKKWGRIKPRTQRTKNEVIQHHGYKEILLYTVDSEVHKDHSVLIDDNDYEELKQYKFGKVGDKRKYAMVEINGKSHRLHRIIMGVKNGLVVDHINGNGLDNRRINLRVCTYSQNNQNNKRKGYSYFKHCKKWGAYIGKDYKTINLGLFNTEDEARKARIEAEKKYFGEFSYHNKNICAKNK